MPEIGEGKPMPCPSRVIEKEKKFLSIKISRPHRQLPAQAAGGKDAGRGESPTRRECVWESRDLGGRVRETVGGEEGCRCEAAGEVLLVSLAGFFLASSGLRERSSFVIRTPFMERGVETKP